MPLKPIPVVEIEAPTTATASIIWLHGLGADGHDFTPLVPQLQLPPRSAVRFIFPHAPQRPVTINTGLVMRAWYDIISKEFTAQEDACGIHDSQQLIASLIRRERERGIPSRCIFLTGFSQGGAMVLHTGLRYEQALGGIAALSTYLPLAHHLADEAHPANQHIPIFMVQGTQDTIVPPALARESRKALENQGYAVDWHEYPMAHEICQEEISLLSRWFSQHLSACTGS